MPRRPAIGGGSDQLGRIAPDESAPAARIPWPSPTASACNIDDAWSFRPFPPSADTPRACGERVERSFPAVRAAVGFNDVVKEALERKFGERLARLAALGDAGGDGGRERYVSVPDFLVFIGRDIERKRDEMVRADLALEAQRQARRQVFAEARRVEAAALRRPRQVQEEGAGEAGAGLAGGARPRGRDGPRPGGAGEPSESRRTVGDRAARAEHRRHRTPRGLAGHGGAHGAAGQRAQSDDDNRRPPGRAGRPEARRSGSRP